MPYANPEKRREMSRIYAMRYYRRNPEKVRVWNRRATQRYRLKQANIRKEQFDQKFAEQGFRCAICLTTEFVGRGRGSPVFDHCHVTGKFRGVLCHNCNVSLGLLMDNSETLHRMIEYLEKSRADL